MVEVLVDVMKKARRRIHRFIETGEPQPRVRKTDDRTFTYWVEHHVEKLTFKLDSLNRLRLQKKEAE